MKHSFDIAIVGGGIAGLGAAVFLANARNASALRIHVIDAAERPVFSKAEDVALRVSAISPGSAELLTQHGAWDTIEQTRSCPYDRMRVWDAAREPDGPATLRFDADELAVPHLGYVVENILVQHALLERLDALGVASQFGTRLQSIEFSGSGSQVLHTDDTTLRADLIIAADGSHSPLRDRAGIECREVEYGQRALVTHVEPEFAHERTAWQRFLETGPIGILPLADGRVSVIWSTSTAIVEEALAADDRKLGEMLTEASGRVLGGMQVAGPRGSFVLAARHAREYVRHGLALVGDAAHTIHPLAGQGANLGIADAWALAQVIDEAVGRGEHPGDRPVLRRYERARRGENTAMMHFLTGLNRLFAADSVMLGSLRRAGMRAFNRGGPVRKRMIDVALGSGGLQ